MHESYVSYRNFFYLKVAAALCAVAIVVYGLHQPHEPPNGGTWLGYTLGTLGAAMMGWLAWFGVRKRRYSGTQGRLVSWLSAHIYLGAALLVIVTLHSGFQLGWNVHSLAYVLTVLVVFSGFYGLYVYVAYPRELAANRGGLTREAMIAEVAELDRECLTLADEVDKEAHKVVLQSIEETVLGGSALEQLFGDPARRSASVGINKSLDAVRQKIEARVARGVPNLQSLEDQDATAISFLAEHMIADGGGPERLEKITRLFELITRKRAMVERIQRDIQLQSRLAFWLYLHVPLSIGLLAALFCHVFAVFFYW
ncbi:MAG: hypothetical protein IT492_09390 [Gammaproteobacteria bacterium]|nr:hypothetical protein [Gammaproteobacteria bacterium]